MLKILPDNSPATIDEIKILSHESLITSKIEFYVSTHNISQTIKFDAVKSKRLGYITLDSNEKSSYRARELKSVSIRTEKVTAIKLVLHENFNNPKNLENQVGLAGIYLIGKESPKHQFNQTMLELKPDKDFLAQNDNESVKQPFLNIEK